MCFTLIKLLQKLVIQSKNLDNEPFAIVATIHQPPTRVFELFERVYVLSGRGQAIYDGKPADLVNDLESMGLRLPEMYNPADFVIEVAAFEYGDEYVRRLAETHDRSLGIERRSPVEGEIQPNVPKKKKRTLDNELVRKTRPKRLPLLYHTSMNMARGFLMIARDPLLTILRCGAHALIALILILMMGNEVGRKDGCPPRAVGIWNFDFVQNETQRLGLKFMPNEKYELKRDMDDYMQNWALIELSQSALAYLSIMLTVITFPLEIKVVQREFLNGWYSGLAYTMGRGIADAPFIILYPTLLSGLVYYFTEQYAEFWRFAIFALVNVLVSFASQSLGLVCGALFTDSLGAVVFSGPIVLIVCVTVSGILIPIQDMSIFFKWVANLTPMWHSFKTAIVAIYGYDRCVCEWPKMDEEEIGDWASCLKFPFDTLDDPVCAGETFDLSETFERIESGGKHGKRNCTDYIPIAYDNFKIDDSDMWIGLQNLILFSLILRILTYFIILYRLKKKI